MVLDLVTGEELMEAVMGQRIVYGEETDDGMHFNLEDGRVLIFTGEFVVSIYNAASQVN